MITTVTPQYAPMLRVDRTVVVGQHIGVQGGVDGARREKRTGNIHGEMSQEGIRTASHGHAARAGHEPCRIDRVGLHRDYDRSKQVAVQR